MKRKNAVWILMVLMLAAAALFCLMQIKNARTGEAPGEIAQTAAPTDAPEEEAPPEEISPEETSPEEAAPEESTEEDAPAEGQTGLPLQTDAPQSAAR